MMLPPAETIQTDPDQRHARAVVIRILSDRKWSLGATGNVLSGRDHTTLLHSRRSFDIYVKENPRVLESYEAHRAAGWCAKRIGIPS